jgi:hypothetical protein
MNREKPDRTERGHGRHLVLESAQKVPIAPPPLNRQLPRPAQRPNTAPSKAHGVKGALPPSLSLLLPEKFSRQKSMAIPFFSQSPKRVGSRPSGSSPAPPRAVRARGHRASGRAWQRGPGAV